jgi:hypothetical protein
LIRIALALAGAILLGWQVVKTSAVDAFVRRQPGAAAAIAPDHPRVSIALAQAEFAARQGRVSTERRAAAIDALAGAALTEEPFYLAAVDALANGREAEGERLLIEARRRDPRSRATRLILLDRYLQTGRVPEAGIEIAALNRLMPRAAEILIPELARMVREPKTGTALIKVLAHEPGLQQAVLARLATAGADPEIILNIAASSKSTAGTPGGLPWQRALLSKLVEQGDLQRAHGLWRSFAGLPADSGGGKGVYDGDFRGAPGAPPFNWQFSTGGAGVAEQVRNPALQIDYYGRENVELATQLLMLRPGRYRLQFRAEGDATGQGSQLLWTVTCTGSKAQLLSLPLREVTYSPRTVSGVFSVPAGCSGQWLKLTGAAGEFPKGQNATVSQLQIVSGGAS